LVTEAPVDNGGTGSEFSPTDLVSTAMATCVLTIMGVVARDHGIDLTGARVHTTKEMVADPRRRIGTVRMAITIPNGAAIGEEDRRRLENCVRACPVAQSLRPEVNVAVEISYP
jgi:putative redox protein